MNFVFKTDFLLCENATVWTDGACKNNGKPNAKGGIGGFWGRDDHPLNFGLPLYGLQTNNRAELTAAIFAISQAIIHGASKLDLYTDSLYVIKCANSSKAILNIDLIYELSLLLKKIVVVWHHVRGHGGSVGNEAADKLAVLGAAM